MVPITDGKRMYNIACNLADIAVLASKSEWGYKSLDFKFMLLQVRLRTFSIFFLHRSSLF